MLRPEELFKLRLGKFATAVFGTRVHSCVSVSHVDNPFDIIITDGPVLNESRRTFIPLQHVLLLTHKPGPRISCPCPDRHIGTSSSCMQFNCKEAAAHETRLLRRPPDQENLTTRCVWSKQCKPSHLFSYFDIETEVDSLKACHQYTFMFLATAKSQRPCCSVSRPNEATNALWSNTSKFGAQHMWPGRCY